MIERPIEPHAANVLSTIRLPGGQGLPRGGGRLCRRAQDQRITPLWSDSASDIPEAYLLGAGAVREGSYPFAWDRIQHTSPARGGSRICSHQRQGIEPPDRSRCLHDEDLVQYGHRPRGGILHGALHHSTGSPHYRYQHRRFEPCAGTPHPRGDRSPVRARMGDPASFHGAGAKGCPGVRHGHCRKSGHLPENFTTAPDGMDTKQPKGTGHPNHSPHL